MFIRILALWLLASAGSAQSRFEFWPATAYDPAIPTHEKVLGYKPGDRISWHSALIKYLEALAAAQPGRMKIWDYATTWEGRKLVYAAIASPDNMRRLAEIQAGYQKLSDPRKTAQTEARKLIETLPSVVWLGYGVHGNEISSPDAALVTAYQLLAARKDPVVEKILANVVVLIDPLQNPDGRDRFVHHFEQSEGIEPDANPSALEHTEPWPSGRTNHYHFDMNRDWFALTQPETRGRIKALLQWFPLVFIDLHEMGADSTYYFTPEAVPFNPHLTREQKSSLDWFGKNNARWFDKYGFSYFTREVYDAFYPGYGASWPSFHGSIAATYEQASTRGLLMRRRDETTFRFRDTVRQHFVASIATLETSADYRKQLLQNFWDYRRTAVEEGNKESIREYRIFRRPDASAADKLAQILAEQGVEVHRASDRYVVRMSQPAKRLARTLLDPQVNMDDFFVKEQERLRKKKLPDEIYDVTGWSLPYLFNVETAASADVTPGEMTLVQPGSPKGSVTGGRAEVAYLAPWGTQAAGRFLTAVLREGLRVHSSDKSFQQGTRTFPRGTLIVKVKENAESVHDTVNRIAAGSGAEVVATNTGWVEEGVNFGSRYVVQIRKPTIAIAWDQPVNPGSAGHTRFVLERQFQFPATPVRTQLLATTDLAKFHVLILPDGSYNTSILARLKDWVQDGGTLIGIGGAMTMLADPKTGVLSIQQETLPKPAGEPKKVGDDGRVPGTFLASQADYEKAIEPESLTPDRVAGVVVKAKTDPDHWVTAGAPEHLYALMNGRTVFAPIKIDKGANAAVFLGPDQLLASGYLWEENRKLLAYKPLVVVQRLGRGHVIGFTADPNYRAFMDGMNVLFLNAVFRGR